MMAAAHKSAETTDLVLEIQNLSVIADGGGVALPIVKDVSISVRRGEVLGIIGESGAGKSTLGLASMGYCRPGSRIASGRVLFNGQDLVAMPEAAKRKKWGADIAYVAQSAATAFNPAYRIMPQCIETPVQHGLASRSTANQRVLELFRNLRLPQPETIGLKFPHQFSGGQLQRAMMAMACSAQPKLIVFDEPTTALDVTTQVGVLASIRKMVRDSNLSAIYVTHDLAVVSQMADRIIVLRHGEIVEEAPTREMIDNPKQPYTRSLWAVRELSKPEDLEAEPLLQLSNINVNYGEFHAVKNVTLNVPRGRTVALVGESGSGKTTVARAIAGLHPPTSGDMRFDKARLANKLQDRPKELLQRIQFIHQSSDAALNPRRRIRSILARALRRSAPRKGDIFTVESLLKLVELPATLADRFPGELSGGQKQRVCIARALAAQPELIICDEVTSALDQIVASGILKLLIDIQSSQNCSLLFITHDLSVVRAIADWVVVMSSGEIVEQGSKTEILDSPGKEYTKQLINSVPQLRDGWLDEISEMKSR